MGDLIAQFSNSYLPFCRTVERLSGVAAKELFKLQEDELIERLGEDEGKRLYNELQVQSGAMTVSNELLSLLSSCGNVLILYFILFPPLFSPAFSIQTSG